MMFMTYYGPICSRNMESKCYNTDEHGRKAIVTMNKKKYSELAQALKEFTQERGVDGDTFAAMCETICRVLAFNPELKAYKADEMRRKKQEYKKKLAEQCLTTYDAYGRAYYEANKDVCNQRTAMCKQRKAVAS